MVVTLLGLIAAATVPPVAAALERSRTLAAARFLQSRMMLARAQAVSRRSRSRPPADGSPR